MFLHADQCQCQWKEEILSRGSFNFIVFLNCNISKNISEISQNTLQNYLKTHCKNIYRSNTNNSIVINVNVSEKKKYFPGGASLSYFPPILQQWPRMTRANALSNRAIFYSVFLTNIIVKFNFLFSFFEQIL